MQLEDPWKPGQGSSANLGQGPRRTKNGPAFCMPFSHAAPPSVATACWSSLKACAAPAGPPGTTHPLPSVPRLHLKKARCQQVSGGVLHAAVPRHSRACSSRSSCVHALLVARTTTAALAAPARQQGCSASGSRTAHVRAAAHVATTRTALPASTSTPAHCPRRACPVPPTPGPHTSSGSGAARRGCACARRRGARGAPCC